MEDDLSNFHHEDDALDRELNSLVREMEHEEAVRPDLAIPACSRVAFTDVSCPHWSAPGESRATRTKLGFAKRARSPRRGN